MLYIDPIYPYISYGYSTLRIHTTHWYEESAKDLRQGDGRWFFCCRRLFPEKNGWVVVAVMSSRSLRTKCNETMNNTEVLVSTIYSLKDLIWSYLFIRSPDVFLGLTKNHAPTPTPLVGPSPRPAAEVMKRLRFARSPPNELDIASTWREEKPSEVKGFGALPKRIVNVAWFGGFFQI